MNAYEDRDCLATAEGDHESSDGQGGESPRRVTIKDLHSVSEPPTDNRFSGPYENPDHTLVYNAVYQSCRDLTACGSCDEICSSTPNLKSKRMHLKNLSATSLAPSVIEYVPSCSSHKMAEQVPSTLAQCGPWVPPTATDIPTFPTIESSGEKYPLDAPLTTPISLSTYIPFATLGRGVRGMVFAARLRDNSDDNIYTLKTIPKASLEQGGVNKITKELWILRFIADASLSNKPFPFLQRLKEGFQDEKNLFIVLEYFPTTLAHTEAATPFRLSQKSTPPGLFLTTSKTYQSEQEVIQALRILAAELTLGLLFLHRHGIVHQDIKPANIMISEGGHAVIGDFGAASVLPIPCQPGGDPFQRPYPSSRVDKASTTYGSIVLQPEDAVTFTLLYAAPELLGRKENGLLIYDARVDWWSLGVLLYEIATGGIPFQGDSENGLFFELLEELGLTGSAAHLDGYLRSLLVHDPSHRLAGEKAKSHPFLEPLQDIWAEIEDLRHPPCPKPSARVLCVGDPDIDLSFDLPEDSSKFDVQDTQILSSRHGFESEPQSPLYEEYHTPREAFSSPEQNSLESPLFLNRNVLQENGSSAILQQEAFMSYYIESSFQTNRSLPVGKPLPSNRRFFSDEYAYGTCTIQRRMPEESFDEDIIPAETSFTDSGLDFPLGSSPESWGHRKSDPFRKPLALRPIYGQKFQDVPGKDRERRVHDKNLAKPKPEMAEHDWTFDEKITISLLQASLKEREISEATVRRRLSKPNSVAAASERIMKAAGRRVADTLRVRRR